MDSVLMENKVLNLDKSSWILTKLGDLVKDISKRVDNPGESEYDRFVGLGNFVSGDIKIKTWETTENLASSAKAFQAGDILFARRNAYLRRASLVNFDGCCSGDAFVLRENHDKVVPGFLAFLLNSDTLWNYANSNAAGTMSKRVKWRDLAEYEFLLPPKGQQAKLAELLWAMDEVIERDNQHIRSIEKGKKSLFNQQVYTLSRKTDKYFGNRESNFPIYKLGDLLKEIQYGISESLSEEGEVPILRMNNLQKGKLDLSDLKYYNPSNGELDKFILEKGDILFNRTNSFDLVGKVSLFNVEGRFGFASYLIRLKSDSNRLDSRYLNFYLNTSLGLAKIRKYRTPGVSQSNINAQNLKNIPIPLPSITSQKELMDKIELFEKSEELCKIKVSLSKSLQKSLINQVF